MPMKAIVTNMGGRIVAEERGGTRRLMQHDAMGNVISLINDAGVVTDTYEYWSYGEIRTQTGSSTNPWKFGGAWGYYTDATGRQYVRARTLRNDLGRWITVDPLWPSEPAYGYAGGSPMVNVDSSGMAPDHKRCSEYKLYNCLKSFRDTGHTWQQACFGCQRLMPKLSCLDARKWFEHYRPPSRPPICPRGRVFPPNPFDWEYGQWCGQENTRTHDTPPQDCVDACCKKHDLCLEANAQAGLSDPCQHKCCNDPFRECIKNTVRSGCCKDSPFPSDCAEAAADIQGAFGIVLPLYEFSCRCKPKCV
jgi:RHS repeat-associated protein